MSKIGIVIDQLNVGGPEKIAFEEVIALNKNGVPTDLVVLRRKGLVDNPFPDLMKKVNIVYLDDRIAPILRMSFRIPCFYFFSLFHLTYPLLLLLAVKKNEYSYFIVHSTYTSLTAITIKLFKGIPFSSFIWDPVSYIIEKVYKERFDGLMYKVLHNLASVIDKLIIMNADFILTGGSAHDKIFKRLNRGVLIQNIPPGVHPALRQSIANKTGYILIATAWKVGKSPEFIFELLKLNPSLHFCLVGKWIDDKYKEKFKQQVKEKGYVNNLTIVGSVTEEELNSYYSRALVFLQINNDKGFGMPALEAAANGTTFIIPEGQGVCELFRDRIDGYFTNEKNATEILQIINELLLNPQVAYGMGQSAWNRVQCEYTWEQHAKKIMNTITNYYKAHD
jgi:glycosyltransferase involved in cell wall biosynthesis